MTEVGAWRNSKVLGYGEVKPDDIQYGGFYTQEDAREIVKYARDRFIEIVPEVDIPGHSQAAVASYPEFLACDSQNSHEVWRYQGVSTDVINVSNPRAVQFAEDVIDELTEVFPYAYLHWEETNVLLTSGIQMLVVRNNSNRFKAPTIVTYR